MNSHTALYQQLAETITRGNQEEISNAILHLVSLGKISSNEIDNCNIPLLITNHAHQNQEAQDMLSSHHRAKSAEFEMDKPRILGDFEAGLRRKSEVTLVPRWIAFLLARLTQLDDEVISRLGFQMFIDLDFEDDNFLDLVPIALRNRRGSPEAMKLREKLEKIRRENEARNLEMEQEQEDLEDEEMEMDDGSDDDDVVSDDSGFGGESNEILWEDAVARMREEQKFVASMAEIFMVLFKQTLQSGQHDEIQGDILLMDELNLPLSLEDYRKHEISRLIVQHASHNDSALQLLEAIEEEG